MTTFSMREGLAHFVVNRIVRDSRGFMWFCTREGLSRYDGYGFTTYRASDGLPSSHITDILETPEGLYWIGTLEGLVLFDPAAPVAPSPQAGVAGRARFTTVTPLGDTRAAAVYSIVREPAGTIWVGTNAGLLRVDAGSEDRRAATAVDLGIPDRFSSRSIFELTIDRRGVVWIAAGERLLVRHPDGRVRMLADVNGIAIGRVNRILEDRDGRIWAAGPAGLWRLALDVNGVPRVVRVHRDELPAVWVTQLFEASDGSLWASTPTGLWRVEESGESTEVGFLPITDSAGVAIDRVSALSEDLSGHLWVGTTSSGALRLPRAGFTTIGENAGLTHASALTETRAGEVAFVGMRGSDWGIFCSDGTGIRVIKPGGPVLEPTWAWNQALFQDSKGDWWFGTWAGIFRYSGARRCADLSGRLPVAHFDSRSGLAADVAIRLFEDTRGDIWMATVGHGVRPDGLSRWVRATGTLHKYSEADGLPSFERHYVSSFAEDKSGGVWIGFSGTAGLARFHDGRFERFTKEYGVPHGQVRDLVVDQAGRLWIASYRGGVVLADDPTAAVPRFRAYTDADGLSSNEIYAVIPDGSGRIYVASAGGIDRFDPETGVDRRYSRADGMPPGEVNAAMRGRDGTLWFAQTTGAFRFTPTERGSATPPRILITDVSVGGEPRPLSAVGQAQVARFSLPHDRNSLQVSFVALGWGAGAHYRYRYLLENGGSGWTPFSEARTLNFANLAPAAYRLVVEARDGQGRITATPAVVEFTVVPAVWQRRWFLGVTLLTAAGAAYGLHRYRVRQVLAIARIRNRIATDLHDDLGANLTKIAVLGEVALQEGPRRDAALTAITGIARESVTNMGDIIWAIDPEHDSMDDVVRKMRQHVSETFADGEAELSFRAPTTLDGRHVEIELRHDLLLVFKEAINNVARHSRCRRIDVRLDVEHDILRLEVSDDGVGFDPTRVSDGRGTGSMRERAARMGGGLEITSGSSGGTTLVLTVPLS